MSIATGRERGRGVFLSAAGLRGDVVRWSLRLFFFCWVFLFGAAAQADLRPLDDSSLREVDGQALIDMQKTTQNGYTFYTVGLDATMNLNLNIQNMQLGCNGINGAGACDISATNVSFGCAQNASGSCIVPPSSCTDPTICTVSADQTVTALKAFVLTNPFLQLAIQNDGTAARSVAGIRMGASQVTGPLSFGNLNSFSGYLSGMADITMQGQSDIAATCDSAHAPCTGTAQSQGCNAGVICGWFTGSPTSDGHNAYGYSQPLKALGLSDDEECISAVIVGTCVAFDSITVNYNTVAINPLAVTVNGNRLLQAFINGANLGDAVHTLVGSLSINQPSGLSGGLLNLVLPALKSDMELKVDNQIATGLGLATSNNLSTVNAELNAYAIPMNLSNIHAIDVNSSNFGLSFQNAAIQYPGYVAPVSRGWAMYAENAFTLVVNQPATNFVSNIATGAAAAGNIVGLQGPYKNCYGSATFC